MDAVAETGEEVVSWPSGYLWCFDKLDVGDVSDGDKDSLRFFQIDWHFSMEPRCESKKDVPLLGVRGPHFRPSVESSLVLQLDNHKLLPRAEHRAPLVR